jgi:hypothetical protein
MLLRPLAAPEPRPRRRPDHRGADHRGCLVALRGDDASLRPVSVREPNITSKHRDGPQPLAHQRRLRSRGTPLQTLLPSRKPPPQCATAPFRA